MTLKEYIFKEFLGYHKGKHCSITRKRLLINIQGFHIAGGFLVNDREMRIAYEELPICGGPKGLYLPETKAEIDEQIKLHWSKIYSYFRKIDILEHYQIESDAIQKNLF